MENKDKSEDTISTASDEKIDTTSSTTTETKEEVKVEEFDEEEIKKAEEFKTKGNAAFKDCKYDLALDMYSEAIFCNVPKEKKAIYYSNRSMTSIKSENYALALFDAKDAIKNNPKFAKAYYRAGAANLALNQYS